jgi:hypothetical protein
MGLEVRKRFDALAAMGLWGKTAVLRCSWATAGLQQGYSRATAGLHTGESWTGWLVCSPCDEALVKALVVLLRVLCIE